MNKVELNIPIEAIDFFSQEDFFWVKPEGSIGGYLNLHQMPLQSRIWKEM